MLISEAIEMLKRMNPHDEVFLSFSEDVVENRNNEHLKSPRRYAVGDDHPCGGSYETQAERFGK